MAFHKDMCGIILAGGNSSRMGTDKALLEINGITIVERAASLMSKHFGDILISVNNEEPYKFLGLPLVPDVYKNYGPLAGLHASLRATKCRKNFVMSCDLPLIDSATIDYLADYKTDKPLVLPAEKEKIHGLCGMYEKKCAGIIEMLFNEKNERNEGNGKNRKLSVMGLIERVGAEIVRFDNLPIYTDELFFNMNAAEDYGYIVDKLKDSTEKRK